MLLLLLLLIFPFALHALLQIGSLFIFLNFFKEKSIANIWNGRYTFPNSYSSIYVSFMWACMWVLCRKIHEWFSLGFTRYTYIHHVRCINCVFCFQKQKKCEMKWKFVCVLGYTWNNAVTLNLLFWSHLFCVQHFSSTICFVSVRFDSIWFNLFTYTIDFLLFSLFSFLFWRQFMASDLFIAVVLHDYYFWWSEWYWN